MSHSLIVLFDGDCPPCRALADWAARAAVGAAGPLTFAPWQEFASSPGATALTQEQRRLPADSLRVLTGTDLLEGEAAWAHLVAAHPSFKQFNWMARRLGLASPEAPAGRVLMKAGAIVRSLCRRCSRPSER